MILNLCKINYELIEVDLKNKPKELIEISQKGTVPVLVLEDGKVIDESVDIIEHYLANEPNSSLNICNEDDRKIAQSLITQNDSYFKYYLDRYKYHVRFPENDQLFYRQKAELFLDKLENFLKIDLKDNQLSDDKKDDQFLLGRELKYLDIVIFPFVRQFCYVDQKWFKQEGKYKNLNKWLKYLEDLRDYVDNI
jgi:glutathione S-transferase